MAADWNEAEFASLFREHYQQILGIVRRVVRSHAEADDVCAEVFWRLYRQGGEAVSSQAVGGWLYRTATRAAIDALRANKRRGDEGTDPPADAVDPRDGPLHNLLRSEEIGEVGEVLARLDVGKAQILLLRYSGLSYAEIASAMEVRPGSVGTMLVRAEEEFCALYQRKARRKRSLAPLGAAKEKL